MGFELVKRVSTVELLKYLNTDEGLSDENAVVIFDLAYVSAVRRKDVESVVEGWAQTGSYVDVILIRRSPEKDLGMEAKVIAENVKILAAGADASEKSVENATAPQTVTLLVTQEDALKVRTASSIGKLTFALRGSGDKGPSVSVFMNQRTLLGGSRLINKQKSNAYKGMARGPNGEVYVLQGGSEWVLSQ